MTEKKQQTKMLADQMEEYSKRKEKIEELKKELLVNDELDIIEDEGEFYAVDFYGEHWRINVELREKLPNSYFHSPECDDVIMGYDHKTGGIIYDLWKAGKIGFAVSEGISSDFYDTDYGIGSSEGISSDFHYTVYGIGKLLSCFEKDGFGDKVPPIHLLPPDFIDYQNRLQGSMNEWGFDINIVKPNISEIDQRRFDMRKHIDFCVKLLEDTSDKSEDFRNTYIKILDDLKKEYAALE